MSSLVLEILRFPDPRLYLKAKKVEMIDESISSLVTAMAELMYSEDGIGLAANQINIQKRFFIMDLDHKPQFKSLEVFINPEILEYRGQTDKEEGCLSVPGIFEKIKRAQWIKLKYQDIEGLEHIVEYEDLKAECVQHEIDHLDGKVFVEYLSKLKQNYIKKKMRKYIK